MNTNNNSAYFIIVHDIQTGETKEYDNKKVLADDLGIILRNQNLITAYINQNKLYKGRYIFSKGEPHEKKVYFDLFIHPALLTELKKIISEVPNTNLIKLTNAICKDFIFKYDNHYL